MLKNGEKFHYVGKVHPSQEQDVDPTIAMIGVAGAAVIVLDVLEGNNLLQDKRVKLTQPMSVSSREGAYSTIPFAQVSLTNRRNRIINVELIDELVDGADRIYGGYKYPGTKPFGRDELWISREDQSMLLGREVAQHLVEDLWIPPFDAWMFALLYMSGGIDDPRSMTEEGLKRFFEPDEMWASDTKIKYTHVVRHDVVRSKIKECLNRSIHDFKIVYGNRNFTTGSALPTFGYFDEVIQGLQIEENRSLLVFLLGI